MKKKQGNSNDSHQGVSDERIEQYMGSRYGQHADTQRRYEEAIRACSDIEYLPKTITEIARLFGHEPERFRMMMKRHYMDVLDERERLRVSLGLNKLPPRGVSQATRAKYEPALQLLRTTDMTVRQAAEATGVSMASLQQHIIFHHKDLAQQRLMRRTQALAKPRKQGEMTANGSAAGPRGTAAEYYRQAVALLTANPAMTYREAALRTGLATGNLSSYIRRWHRDLMTERERWRHQQTKQRQQAAARLSAKEQAASRYAAVLPVLEQGATYQEAAFRLGVPAERLRVWVRRNRPDIHAMKKLSEWVTLPNGYRVKRTSWQRYEAPSRHTATPTSHWRR